jgi:phosphatidylethanolamine/phosphatidyl-N-methylethanolamine N-methyltransferase
MSIAEVFCHLSEYARSPSTIGAVAPSSRTLAAAMTSIVPCVRSGDAIVELGPGTGAITRGIVDAWPANPILAVEKNPRLAARLRARFPEVDVLQGCVSDALDELAESGKRIGVVMSGLPMLSFEETFRERVLTAIHHALSPSAFFVQFTYSERAWRGFAPRGFELIARQRVLRNVPPATILCYQRS